jgi:Rieske Fe-S protein
VKISTLPCLPQMKGRLFFSGSKLAVAFCENIFILRPSQLQARPKSFSGATEKFMPERDQQKLGNVDRRGFFKRALATIIGVVLGLVPIGAGLTVLLDPLRRKTTATGLVRITALEALPNDGVPRKFPVVATRVDAWNKFARVPVGAVYLRRIAEDKVEAFNVVCPHAGCFVDFLEGRKIFHCPCHNSTFASDGKISDPSSPAPRPLDTLEVQIRNKEVWVKFQNFQAGRAEKIPVA